VVIPGSPRAGKALRPWDRPEGGEEPPSEASWSHRRNCPKPDSETGGLGAPLRVEADLSTQARVKAACELTAQPKLGNGRGALERWPRKQALTICRGAGTEQRGEVGLSHVIERIADRNVCERHPPRHQEVTTLQPLLE